MPNAIDDFFQQNQVNGKRVILSLDLDNTLVIRDKGANYVNPKIKALLIKLTKGFKTIVLPNTGRDLIGYSSFQREVLPLKDAILGSGSIIINDNQKFFDKRSLISKKVLKSLLRLVENGTLTYLDLADMRGRRIFYQSEALVIKDLFFSQNPKEWFLKQPPTLPVKKFTPVDLSSVFRIEFPVSPKNELLFDSLVAKKKKAIFDLSELLGLNEHGLNDYMIKNKLFFNEKYQGKYVFARFEKNASLINKSLGLKNWLKLSGLSQKYLFIVHIGDKDSGLINDTIIKNSVPKAKVVMVGQKCQPGNPLVDLYLRGPVEEELLIFLKGLINNCKNRPC